MRQARIIDIETVLHHETEKAVLVSLNGNRDKAVWLPKSAIEVEGNDGKIVTITLPEQLATDKEAHMTPEQQVAYINAMVACALAEIAGMQAENRVQEIRNETPAYREADFQAVIIRYGIHHNSVIGMFTGG